MMPKNIMEYLVAIIALVALGLSIAAIAKKCKDNFAAPGTCMNKNAWGPPLSCGGYPCDTDVDDQYCSNTYGCDECVADGPPGPGPSPPCPLSIGQTCNKSHIDELYYNCNPRLTCLIPSGKKQGKVVKINDGHNWSQCGGSGSGCYALSKKDSHGKISTGGGCCKNENYECVGQDESNKPPFQCQQID